MPSSTYLAVIVVFKVQWTVNDEIPAYVGIRKQVAYWLNNSMVTKQ